MLKKWVRVEQITEGSWLTCWPVHMFNDAVVTVKSHPWLMRMFVKLSIKRLKSITLSSLLLKTWFEVIFTNSDFFFLFFSSFHNLIKTSPLPTCLFIRAKNWIKLWYGCATVYIHNFFSKLLPAEVLLGKFPISCLTQHQLTIQTLTWHKATIWSFQLTTAIKNRKSTWSHWCLSIHTQWTTSHTHTHTHTCTLKQNLLSSPRVLRGSSWDIHLHKSPYLEQPLAPLRRFSASTGDQMLCCTPWSAALCSSSPPPSAHLCVCLCVIECVCVCVCVSECMKRER